MTAQQFRASAIQNRVHSHTGIRTPAEDVCCPLAIEMSQILQGSESMNKPDSKDRPRRKRRSLVVVAVILMPFVAYMAWPDRPLSSEEQRLVGRWTIQSEGRATSQELDLQYTRLGTTTIKGIGGTYASKSDWRILNDQLMIVPYQYRSQKTSIKNLYQHCVLVINSITTRSPYPADDRQLFSMRWIDGNTLELTAVPGSFVPAGHTFTMHRKSQ